MSQIRLITFDLDNTLWDVDRVIIQAEKQMKIWLAEHVPQSLDVYTPEFLAPMREQVAKRFPDKIHDLSFMRTEVLFELMRSLGMSADDARHYATSAFEVFYTGRNQVEFFTGALTMLEILSRQFPLIALTNGNAHIKHAGIDHFFKGAYSSADVGSSKPDPEMFHAALASLDLQPEQAIHIGDHLIDDIQGANNVGMRTIWVNLNKEQLDATSVAPTAEVNDLLEVPDAVEEVVADRLG